jgi:hypothetical protein
MPTGIYLRTEYHKEILRKNGFKEGEKKPPFSEKHRSNISLALKG